MDELGTDRPPPPEPPTEPPTQPPTEPPTQPPTEPPTQPPTGPPPGPAPVPPRLRDRPGTVGALLCLVAAALTVIGTLQDFVSVSVWVGTVQRFTLIISAWTVRPAQDGTVQVTGGVTLNGLPLLAGAALLLAAAGLLAFGAGRLAGRAGALTAVVAAAFLVATAGNVALQVRWWSQAFGESDARLDSGSESVIGAGLWSVLLAAGVAVLAAVLAWRAGPRPTVRTAEREEPETPRLGIPVLVHRLPDAPADGPPADQR